MRVIRVLSSGTPEMACFERNVQRRVNETIIEAMRTATSSL
jgi:hypothetical protein